MRGFGPNEVDLRGTRRPSSATWYTCAADIGPQITAVPLGSESAARTASAASWMACTLRTSSSIAQIRANSRPLQHGRGWRRAARAWAKKGLWSTAALQPTWDPGR